jgi:hypothetical protein
LVYFPSVFDSKHILKCSQFNFYCSYSIFCFSHSTL